MFAAAFGIGLAVILTIGSLMSIDYLLDKAKRNELRKNGTIEGTGVIINGKETYYIFGK
jgi:hypothetical protein